MLADAILRLAKDVGAQNRRELADLRLQGNSRSAKNADLEDNLQNLASKIEQQRAASHTRLEETETMLERLQATGDSQEVASARLATRYEQMLEEINTLRSDVTRYTDAVNEELRRVQISLDSTRTIRLGESTPIGGDRMDSLAVAIQGLAASCLRGFDSLSVDLAVTSAREDSLWSRCRALESRLDSVESLMIASSDIDSSDSVILTREEIQLMIESQIVSMLRHLLSQQEAGLGTVKD